MAPNPAHAAAAEARALRHRLESYHGRRDPAAVDVLWPHLGGSDATLRYAARIALESQEPSRWQARALAETNAPIALAALLGLARVGPPESQTGLLRALGRFPLAMLDEPSRLLKLRVIELSFLRQGRPDLALVQLAIDKLGPRFPAGTWAENRELARLLLWLGAPDVVPRTLDLLEKAPAQEQQIHYVSQLRHVRDGWTPADRRRYFAWFLQPRDHLQRPGSLLHWFQDVGREYVDGANLDRHLETFRRDAIAALSPATGRPGRTSSSRPSPGRSSSPVRPRAFVREWTMAELLADLDRASVGRDYERGRRGVHRHPVPGLPPVRQRRRCGRSRTHRRREQVRSPRDSGIPARTLEGDFRAVPEPPRVSEGRRRCHRAFGSGIRRGDRDRDRPAHPDRADRPPGPGSTRSGPPPCRPCPRACCTFWSARRFSISWRTSRRPASPTPPPSGPADRESAPRISRFPA
jgi:hypothetical protein